MEKELKTNTTKRNTPCGNLYITISADPFRIFLNIGKTGACAYAHLKTIETLLNIIGTLNMKIINSLKGINCHQGNGDDSCINELGKALEEIFLSHQSQKKQI